MLTHFNLYIKKTYIRYLNACFLSVRLWSMLQLQWTAQHTRIILYHIYLTNLQVFNICTWSPLVPFYSLAIFVLQGMRIYPGHKKHRAGKSRPRRYSNPGHLVQRQSCYLSRHRLFHFNLCFFLYLILKYISYLMNS